VSWWRRFAALFLVVGAVVWPDLASAATGVQLETRVGGIELVVHALVGGSSARSPEKHLGTSPAYDEIALGYSLAAEGVETASTYVYRLVDESGDAVYYGMSNDPARRLAEHAAEGAFPFNGMQVISDAQPLAQARALESSLIQQAVSEGRTIYNVAPNSISPLIPVQVPSTVPPLQTLLNPKLY
jgi:hypothetical protein